VTGVARGRVAAAVALYGVVASAYLTWVHYSGTLALCIGVGGCETVQTSRYAEAGPLPVALVGLVGFIPMAALALWRLRVDAPDWTLTALFGLSLAGTLYVAYLTYLELFVIAAICPWCVSVALAAVGLFLLTVMELRST
jgi:uncharacterized membrane protein